MEVQAAYPALTPPASDERLRARVREHEVCGEIDPQFEMHHGEKVQVGFRLSLLAQPPLSCSVEPGCPHCAAVFECLVAIARRVIPHGARFEIEPFDGSFHLRPETRWAPEVELVAEVLHREGTFDPPDEGERSYPAQIRRELAALGVQPKAWRTRRGPTRLS